MTKRLISTFIATIILVTLSVGIGVMIYFYFSGYLSKTQSQIEELPIKSMLECSKANIDIFGKAIATGTNLLSNWQYKRSILINNTANSNTLTDYQVLIILNTTELISANKMRDDCGDIRFTDSDGTTLLNYWIEPNTCNTNKTRIWVKVPSIPANDQKTIYMYYGNSLATSLSNGTATFIAFDLKAEGPLGHASVGGHSHSCAIVSNGSVYCWGYNSNGQLGNGNSGLDTFSPIPVQVIGIDDVIAIGLGGWHSCAIVSNGSVYCWGSNWYGELGKGTFGGNSPVPVKVVGLDFGGFYDKTNGIYSIPNQSADIYFVRKYTYPEPSVIIGNEEKVVGITNSIKLVLANFGTGLGKKFNVKLEYEDGNIVYRNITLNKTFETGESIEVYLTDLPKGKIKKITIYSLDVCPNIIVGIKNVNIEI